MEMAWTLAVVNQKGGVGKTTLAIHLAHELKSQFPSLRITVTDADPQKSASNWIDRGTKRGIKDIAVTAVATDGEGKGLKKELDSINWFQLEQARWTWKQPGQPWMFVKKRLG